MDSLAQQLLRYIYRVTEATINRSLSVDLGQNYPCSQSSQSTKAGLPLLRTEEVFELGQDLYETLAEL